jgi:hypothetical protein
MQENFYGFIDGMVACSVGMSENSPAFQRREAGRKSSVPQGRLSSKNSDPQPFLRNLCSFDWIPALKQFWREFLLQVEQNELPVRGWLGAANRVLKLTTSLRSRKIAKRYNIDWSEILPLREIAQSEQEKIIRFREYHLRR